MPNKILLSADIESLIDTTLKEDIQTGDITTRNIISPGQVCESELIAKEDLVLSGIEIFKTLFRKLDLQTQFLFEPFKDGDRVPKGSSLLKFQYDSIKAL